MDTAVAIRTLEATYKSSADAAAVESMILRLTEKVWLSYCSVCDTIDKFSVDLYVCSFGYVCHHSELHILHTVFCCRGVFSSLFNCLRTRIAISIFTFLLGHSGMLCHVECCLYYSRKMAWLISTMIDLHIWLWMGRAMFSKGQLRSLSSISETWHIRRQNCLCHRICGVYGGYAPVPLWREVG